MGVTLRLLEKHDSAYRSVLAALAVVSVGCGPFLTTIPTYWDPELGSYTKVDEPPVTSVAAKADETTETEPETDSPDDFHVEIAPDTPEECLAIYALTSRERLVAFSPQDNEFKAIGELDCHPSSRWSTPFSMAVSQSGEAYVVYQDGQLYRVDLRDASCEATPYRTGQPPGYRLFGMGYAANDDGGESLYVAEISFRGPSKGLATIEPTTGKLSHVARFSENPGFAVELTPTGTGPLYGFFINEPGPGGTLVQVDTSDGTLEGATKLDVGTASSSLAIAWWGGRFFIFTGGWQGTAVTRYDADSGDAKQVARYPQAIVGAGVSTCAPSGH